MPNTEYITPDEARFNKELAGKSGRVLSEMVKLLETITDNKAAQITFGPGETPTETLRALTRASGFTGIKIKRERYNDNRGRNVLVVYLTEKPQRARGRRRPGQQAGQEAPSATEESSTNRDLPDTQDDQTADGPQAQNADTAEEADHSTEDPDDLGETDRREPHDAVLPETPFGPRSGGIQSQSATRRRIARPTA